MIPLIKIGWQKSFQTCLIDDAVMWGNNENYIKLYKENADPDEKATEIEVNQQSRKTVILYAQTKMKRPTKIDRVSQTTTTRLMCIISFMNSLDILVKMKTVSMWMAASMWCTENYNVFGPPCNHFNITIITLLQHKYYQPHQQLIT